MINLRRSVGNVAFVWRGEIYIIIIIIIIIIIYIYILPLRVSGKITLKLIRKQQGLSVLVQCNEVK
jgi:hypothetical protein